MLAMPLHEIKHALLAKHMVLILHMIGSTLSPQELKSYFINGYYSCTCDVVFHTEKKMADF